MASSVIAHAQPAPDSPPPDPNAGPPSPPPVMVAPPPAMTPPPSDHPGVDRGVVEDARSGNSFFAPTALTPPAGTWWFSDNELLYVTAGYAVTNELSISASTVVPVVDEMPITGFLQAKLQVARVGRLRLALQGGLFFVGDQETDTVDDGNGNVTSSNTRNWYYAGEVGAAATICFDDDCYSHGSVFAGTGFAGGDNSTLPLTVAGSLAARLTKHVKLIGEIDTAYLVGKINDSAGGFLLWYGLRFSQRNLGVDVGFVKPIVDGDDGDDGLPLGVPWVAFTYRGE